MIEHQAEYNKKIIIQKRKENNLYRKKENNIKVHLIDVKKRARHVVKLKNHSAIYAKMLFFKKIILI